MWVLDSLQALWRGEGTRQSVEHADIQQHSTSSDDIPDESFVYSGLGNESDPDMVRLLRLSPGTFNETLAFELIHVSLNNDLPPYTAISYTWDGQTPSVPTICGS